MRYNLRWCRIAHPPGIFDRSGSLIPTENTSLIQYSTMVRSITKLRSLLRVSLAPWSGWPIHRGSDTIIDQPHHCLTAVVLFATSSLKCKYFTLLLGLANRHRKRPARLNAHLLQCARQRLITEERAHMTRQFHEAVKTCQWLDCGFRFHRGTCGSYSIHVTEHLIRMKAHQCLWSSCYYQAKGFQELAYHLSHAHRVPNDWTMLTKMHYCYEHDEWCRSDQQWTQHITREHLTRMNDFCGLIRHAGVVMVAAHCLFCLGDVSLPITTRFTQFHDVFTLHKHMKEHSAERTDPLTVCPLHPRCTDPIDLDDAF